MPFCLHTRSCSATNPEVDSLPLSHCPSRHQDHFCFAHLAFTTVQRLSCSVSSFRHSSHFSPKCPIVLSVLNYCSRLQVAVLLFAASLRCVFCSPDRSLSSPGVGFHSRPQAVVCRPLPSVVFRCRSMLAFDTPGLLLVVCASRFPVSRSRSFEQALAVGRRFLVCFLFCE